MMKLCFATSPAFQAYNDLMNEQTQRKLDELGWTLEVPPETVTKENLAEYVKDCDGIITTWQSPRMDQKMLDANPKLKIVGHAAGSVADYVSPELFEAGVKVTTANDLMAQAVADWCLTMTLVGLRRFMDYASFGGATKINWNMKPRAKFVQSATIGIWGFGSIAGHYVDMLKPLNPDRILVHSGHLSEADAAAKGMRKAGFNELFEQSDVVLLLTSLTPETIGMVGREQLELMQDDTVLINCGRGKLLNEEALCSELRKERITAILDVFNEEPLSNDSPLNSMPNAILTPHNAGRPSRSGYVALILDEFHRFFSGQPLKYEITRERAGTMTTQTPR